MAKITGKKVISSIEKGLHDAGVAIVKAASSVKKKAKKAITPAVKKAKKKAAPKIKKLKKQVAAAKKKVAKKKR